MGLGPDVVYSPQLPRGTGKNRFCCRFSGILSPFRFSFLASEGFNLAVLAIVLLPLMLAHASEAPDARVATLDLGKVGFDFSSHLARFSKDGNFTLDFVDSNHVLVTFKHSGLVRRQANCPPTHHDRYIDAYLYEVPSGKLVKQTQWYVHDTRPYLWSLGESRFLLRRGQNLYQIDSELREKLIFESPKELSWVDVTPDGKQILIEFAVSPGEQVEGAGKKDLFAVTFLDSATLAPQRSFGLGRQVDLEALSMGYADVVRSSAGKVWLVRFGPDGGARFNVTRVRTPLTPTLHHPSFNTVLVVRSNSAQNGTNVSAFTVTGHNLWRQKWSGRSFASVLAREETGARFAVASLRRPPDWTADKPWDVESESADKEAWEQVVEVFETASGNRLFSETVRSSNVMPYSRTFAVSPGGGHVALLRDKQVEVYGLPPIPPDLQARNIALRKDVPGPRIPGNIVSEADELAAAIDDEAGTVSTSGPDLPASAKAPASPASPTPSAAAAQAGAATAEAAAAPSPAEPPSVTIKSRSLAVLVDVVARDSKNRPVEGLLKDDFAMLEDGKAQKVRYFDELKPEPEDATQPAKTATAPSGEVAPPKEPNVFSNLSDKPEGKAVNIVLLDTLNTPLEDQQNAQRQLLEFLKNKPKDMPVALFSLSANLRMVLGFTEDSDKLVAAMQKKGKITAPMIQPGSSSELVTSLLSNSEYSLHRDAPGVANTMDFMRRSASEADRAETDRRVAITADAFMQLARYFSGVPGRKNLIWLSASFPAGVVPDLNLNDPFSTARNYHEAVRRAMDLMAAARIVVYPVAVRSMHSSSLFDAASDADADGATFQGAQTRNSDTGMITSAVDGTNRREQMNLGPQVFNDMHNESATNSARDSSMEEIANFTGGKAFMNANAIKKAIETAIDHGAHYYSLAYSPANTNFDGNFRKLKVNVARRGTRLEYRKGYYADDPEAPPKQKDELNRDITLASMQHGSPESRQISFMVQVAPVGKPYKVQRKVANSGEKNKNQETDSTVEVQRYIIDYAVPTSQLRFSPAQAGKYQGELHLMLTTFNKNGQMLSRYASAAKSEFNDARYNELQTAGFRLRQQIEIPANASWLRMGMLDALTRKLGTLEIPVPVPPLPASSRARRSLPPIEPD